MRMQRSHVPISLPLVDVRKMVSQETHGGQNG